MAHFALHIQPPKGDFNLTTPTGAFGFFFKPYKLPSALPTDPELSNASSYLSQLCQKVHHAGLEGFTGKKLDELKPKHHLLVTHPLSTGCLIQGIKCFRSWR